MEIQHPKRRYGIIDYERLMELMGVSSLEQLQQACREQIEEAIQRKRFERQSQNGAKAWRWATRLVSKPFGSN